MHQNALLTRDRVSEQSGMPSEAFVQLMLPYLLGGRLERAALAGLDTRGCLRAFADIDGEAHHLPSLLRIVRSILGETSVTGLVLAHSHPTSSCTPSAQDRLTTDRLSALARLAGATLIDHLIVGVDGIHSMAANRQFAAGDLAL